MEVPIVTPPLGLPRLPLLNCGDAMSSKLFAAATVVAATFQIWKLCPGRPSCDDPPRPWAYDPSSSAVTVKIPTRSGRTTFEPNRQVARIRMLSELNAA